MAGGFKQDSPGEDSFIINGDHLKRIIQPPFFEIDQEYYIYIKYEEVPLFLINKLPITYGCFWFTKQKWIF